MQQKLLPVICRATQEHLVNKLQEVLQGESIKKVKDRYRSLARQTYGRQYRKPLVFAKKDYQDHSKRDRAKAISIMTLQTTLKNYIIQEKGGRRVARYQQQQPVAPEEEQAAKQKMNFLHGFKVQNFVKGRYDGIFQSMLQLPLSIKKQKTQQPERQAQIDEKCSSRRRANTENSSEVHDSKIGHSGFIALKGRRKLRISLSKLPENSNARSSKAGSPGLNKGWLGQEVAKSQDGDQKTDFTERLLQIRESSLGAATNKTIRPVITLEQCRRYLAQYLGPEFAGTVAEMLGIKAIESIESMNSLLNRLLGLSKDRACLFAFFLYDQDRDGLITHYDLHKVLALRWLPFVSDDLDHIAKEVSAFYSDKAPSFVQCKSYPEESRLLQQYLRQCGYHSGYSRISRKDAGSTTRKMYISQIDQQTISQSYSYKKPTVKRNQDNKPCVSICYDSFCSFFNDAPAISRQIKACLVLDVAERAPSKAGRDEDFRECAPEPGLSSFEQAVRKRQLIKANIAYLTKVRNSNYRNF